MKLLSSLLCFLFVMPALSAGLSAPRQIRTSAVLPKGVRNFGVGALTTMVDSWYNNSGTITGVAEPMIQPLSYARLLKAEPNAELRQNIKATLNASGVDINALAGTSLADINTRVTATIPSLAVGVTKWWTLGVGVPVVYTNIDYATSFRGTPQLQEVMTNLSKNGRVATKVVEQKLADVVGTELEGKQYLPMENRERTELGDVSVISKMQLYKGLGLRWTMLNRVNIPTARTRAINRLVDPAPGDGQWDFSIVSITDIPVTGKFGFYHEIGHNFQIADHQDARIPFSAGERLSPDIDENAYRDMGDISHTQLGFLFTPDSLFTFGLAYFASYKQRDYWTGSKASQSRYDIIGIETEQYMQAALVQLGTSTIEKFRQGKFPLPLTANLSYSHVFDGRNVRNAPLVSMNLAMYF